MRARITLNTDTFHAVHGKYHSCMFQQRVMKAFIAFTLEYDQKKITAYFILTFSVLFVIFSLNCIQTVFETQSVQK